MELPNTTGPTAQCNCCGRVGMGPGNWAQRTERCWMCGTGCAWSGGPECWGVHVWLCSSVGGKEGRKH